MRVIRALVLLCCGLCFLASCAGSTGVPFLEEHSPAATAAPTPSPPPAPTPAPTPEPTPEPTPVRIRITAVGDNLLHSGIGKNARQADGSYDFRHLFTHVKPLLAGSDIAYINQETMLAGGVSGYPLFSSPPEVADALLDAGFNVVSVANNHCLDKGADGLERCLDALHALPFDAVIGGFLSEEDRDTPRIVEKQGVRIGLLSYTYGFNGLVPPKNREYMVAQTNRERIEGEAAVLREQCDYLIVSMHWGYEYHHKPNDEQRELAQLLCDLGVDLVIGSHPHVLQPMEWLEREDGHRMLCAYSLGNFISTQQDRNTMLGGLLEMELLFDAQTMAYTVDFAGIVPLVTHYQKGGNTTYPVSAYTAELAASHGIRSYTKALTLDYLWELARTVLGDDLREGAVLADGAA